MKYIKIHDGFAINSKTAWIGYVQQRRKRNGSLWSEDVEFFFCFGDERESFTLICDTREEALKAWEEALKLINDNYET